MKRVPAAALLLAACHQPAPAPAPPPGAGGQLERAALAAGLVTAPEAAQPVGVFQSDGDLVCLLPRAAGGQALGVSVDYGEGQRCVAHGTAQGRDRLSVDLGGGCTFTATLDGDRLAFPAMLPEACARSCSGRATLTALSLERLSAAAAEAARTRGADGALLCPG